MDIKTIEKVTVMMGILAAFNEWRSNRLLMAAYKNENENLSVSNLSYLREIGRLHRENESLRRELNICNAKIHNREDQGARDNLKIASMIDAIKIFASRYKISAAELNQLGVGNLIPAEPTKQGYEKASISFECDNSDPLEALNDGNKIQQTNGKFRELRKNFIEHQRQVTLTFDSLQQKAKRKPVTENDISEARQAASHFLMRKV